MKVDIQGIIALATALQPFVAPALVTVEHVVGALRGAGAMTDAEADTDMTALIGEALAAKAEADRAARGEDTR